jgi:hypothetical protein
VPGTSSEAAHQPERWKWKAEQEKQRKEQAIANVTGLRVLAVSAAVPVRLMKRDLLFVIEKLVSTLDDNRIEMLARQHGIRQKRDSWGVRKMLAAFLRSADEGNYARDENLSAYRPDDQAAEFLVAGGRRAEL